MNKRYACIYLLSLFFLPLSTYAGRTFINQFRHHDVQTGALCYGTHTHGESIAPLFDGSLRVTGFYEQMLQSKTVGSVLGYAQPNARHNFALINTQAVVSSEQADAVNNFFVHADTSTNNTLSTAISMAPSTHSYGAIVSYEHYIPLLSSWYVGIQLPLVESRRKLNLSFPDAPLYTPGELLNYFGGAYGSDTAGRAQEKVEHLIFDMHEAEKSGPGQVQLTLRKHLYKNSRITVDIRGECIIPLMSPATTSLLYAPTIGTNGHYQVGATATASFLGWNGTSHCFGAEVRAHAAYCFGCYEDRVIPFGTHIAQHPLGHYALLTHVASRANDKLIPASHVFTQSCLVTPGVQLEGTGACIYKHNDWQWSAGYTYAYADAESVSLPTWSDGGYALAGSQYTTTASYSSQSSSADAIAPITTVDGSTHTNISATDFDATLSGAPQTHAHTMWVQGTYAFKLSALTCYFSMGASCVALASDHVGMPISAWGGLTLKV